MRGEPAPAVGASAPRAAQGRAKEAAAAGAPVEEDHLVQLLAVGGDKVEVVHCGTGARYRRALR